MITLFTPALMFLAYFVTNEIRNDKFYYKCRNEVMIQQ